MSTATLQKPITRADARELRWLANELIADQVISMDAGSAEGGTFSDINKLLEYAVASAAIGRTSDIDDEEWSPWSLEEQFPQIEPLLAGAAELEATYRDCAIYGGPHYLDAARRVAHARQLIGRLRLLHDAQSESGR